MLKDEYHMGGVLDESDCVSLLMFLEDHFEEIIFVSSLRKVVNTYDRLIRMIGELASLGLLVQDKESTPRIKTQIKLTENGREVANRLKEICKIINEETPDETLIVKFPIYAKDVKKDDR
jgi:DNA-binding HxlR family transcriptional regulator